MEDYYKLFEAIKHKRCRCELCRFLKDIISGKIKFKKDLALKKIKKQRETRYPW